MAQFSEIPNLTIVSQFVKEVTGHLCEPDSSWSIWLPGNPIIVSECLIQIRSWYRPCHLKILNETEDGMHSNPCALIRQLLRPHGLTILYRNKTWKIVKSKKGVTTGDEKVVDWA